MTTIAAAASAFQNIIYPGRFARSIQEFWAPILEIPGCSIGCTTAVGVEDAPLHATE